MKFLVQLKNGAHKRYLLRAVYETHFPHKQASKVPNTFSKASVRRRDNVGDGGNIEVFWIILNVFAHASLLGYFHRASLQSPRHN